MSDFDKRGVVVDFDASEATEHGLAEKEGRFWVGNNRGAHIVEFETAEVDFADRR